MEEKQFPKARSFKTGMSYALSATVNINTEEINLTANSVIILTAAGTIYGTPCLDLSQKDGLNNKLLSAVYDNAAEMTVSDVPRYCLILKNATLLTSNNEKRFFETLFVFPDDIIAITMGNTSDF